MKINISTRRSAQLRNPAYTLVEVLVASALLGMVLVILFGGFSQGYEILNLTRQDLRATQIMTQKTEAVRLCTWAELTNLPATFLDYYAEGITVTSNNPAVATYFGTISVANPTNLPGTVSYSNVIKLVTINLLWTNHFGSQAIVHTRQMQTMAAYNGLENYIYGTAP